MHGPELALILTSYQKPWHLRLALESITWQQTNRRLEIFVCDDGSTDETPQIVADFAARSPHPVRFLTHPHDGFQAARCRNEGVRHSTAPCLLFCDGDCLLPPDHIEQHFRFWQSGAVNCGYCVRFGPGLSQYVQTETVSSGLFTSWAPSLELRKLRRMHYKSLLYRFIRHPTKPAFRSTDFFLSREDLLRVNGFDENYRGWGCEDDDLGRRFRSAGIRLRSVLHRTRVYHLWHPPAPSRPQEWKQGDNVGYLQRPIRLTRCLRGYYERRPGDLTVRIVGQSAGDATVERLVTSHGWKPIANPRESTDLELLVTPGSGKFSGHADCRVLAVQSENASAAADAQIVLSPRGNCGWPHQIRLRLDDQAGLWAALCGRDQSQRRAAA